jgi:hypothetical protein
MLLVKAEGTTGIHLDFEPFISISSAERQSFVVFYLAQMQVGSSSFQYPHSLQKLLS